ncbi:hypothetical protein [Paenibacillus xylaniclasticus]|uniref:hypothetical protein n=1 Tax=Paenibacillus xylaniclasticus TaxID=588083 RepID=UPI000FD753AA|nr:MULTISPECIES: hypothetical protein [Paenibacillus]GFN33863.1 hypothetical protein PCURB6_41230 [Paenibacillus curdlanolyticus]
MRLLRTKKLAVLFACCAFMSGTINNSPIFAETKALKPAHSVTQTPEEQKRLANQVQIWIDELAKQRPFAAWSGAEFTIEALGPGTHAWYVLITAGGRPVGYMIVNAKEKGGYELGEYGTGKRPLFDIETLRLSLNRHGIGAEDVIEGQDSRLYVNGLFAVWRVETKDRDILYADAATGEILPTTERQWTSAAAAVLQAAASPFPESAGTRSHIYKTHLRQSFDVYAELPWLTSQPICIRQANHLLKPIGSDQPVRYVADLYDHSATFMWGVVGYQQWSNDAVYLALEEPDPEGSGLSHHVRYISLSSLYPFGLFYLSS